MSFIARCPSCQTCYKVVPDQLRISDGWVRCGHCGEVFDALALPPQSMHAGTALRDESTGFTESATVDHQLFFDGEAIVNPPGPEAWQPDEAPWESAALLIKPASEFEAETEPQLEGAKSGALAPEPVADSVSFLFSPDVRKAVLQDGKRVLRGSLSVVLLLGLLGQGLYHERDQLAALIPDMKPAMQSFCEVVGCRVLPLHRIEALVLDSATFHQVNQETFQLHFVVKNKTQLALALPAIELTLTDLTDQPVMRRVLIPAELGATTETIAAAGEWSATAYLRVQAEPARARALGYRLLVFYP
ncbi:MAG: hypothetical protein CVU24_14780 [Betaproteobacteria bacterium HGW-Betaproteobacteria-18]|nr:MAG: hypothetical protein CVU24_14780 [Betaproteobacteria bacterium HGW-Betaproteobacteria-18]